MIIVADWAGTSGHDITISPFSGDAILSADTSITSNYGSQHYITDARPLAELVVQRSNR